jgi:hypothetical protein
MDMADADFDRLALRYGQLGTLVWTRGEPIRLRMYARQPLMARPRDHVEWMPADAAGRGARIGARMQHD